MYHIIKFMQFNIDSQIQFNYVQKRNLKFKW